MPPDNRLYCIGDIHGRLDLLLAAHRKIAEDSADFTGPKTLVYLGDYVDRGPDSRQVVDYLLENGLSGFLNVYLLGNHEQILLDFLFTENPVIGHEWLRFGGIQTLLSYGVQIRGIPTQKELALLRSEFRQKLPPAHLHFFERLQLSYEAGGYFFVHAGIRPGVKLNRQLPEDMLWIRDEFLSSGKLHGKMIVHGHSVSDEPEVRANRIGLDTGAYASGKLSCAVFEGADWRFL